MPLTCMIIGKHGNLISIMYNLLIVLYMYKEHMYQSSCIVYVKNILYNCGLTNAWDNMIYNIFTSNIHESKM